MPLVASQTVFHIELSILSLQVVKDPLFELAITLCIVLNTMFLALEHHGMSDSVRQALDIGNKVCAALLIILFIALISCFPDTN